MFGVCPSIFVFLEMKTTQNKSKWCLLNTPFNQISLNKKKKKANQARPKDCPEFDPTRLT